MPEHEVSHGDIYHKLGSLEGKLDVFTSSLGQKQTDLAEAFRRLGELEKNVAKWAGIALACSLIVPLLINAAAPRLHFGQPPAAQADGR